MSEKYQEYIQILQAAERGETIQIQAHDKEWIDDENFSANFSGHKYRVKPKPFKAYINVYQHSDEPISEGIKNGAAVVQLYASREEAESNLSFGAKTIKIEQVEEKGVSTRIKDPIY